MTVRIVHGVVIGSRKRPTKRTRLKFRSYLPFKLENLPASQDWTAGGGASTSAVFCNDRLGCCVIAKGYHVTGIATGNASVPPGSAAFIASDAQIIADYSAIGGYDPSDPSTDQGCDPIAALQYWISKGFANGTKLLGFASVDATNPEEVKSAIFLFENVSVDMELPDDWLGKPPEDGDVWDVAGPPNPDNGHSTTGGGYGQGTVITQPTADGVTLITWGKRILLTWAALAKYAVPSAGGDCTILFTPDEVAKGEKKAPNGLDWDTLGADLQNFPDLVEAPPGPSPAPPQPPAPAPSPPAPVPPPAPSPPVPLPPTPVTTFPASAIATRVKTTVTAWQASMGTKDVTLIDLMKLESSILKAIAG